MWYLQVFNCAINKMKKSFILWLCIFITGLSYAQEKLGIANSNYSSTNSIFLNPSSSVDSRTYIQVNLIGLNAYEMNNTAYLPKFNLWSTIRNNERTNFKANSLKLKKFVLFSALADGPAFVMSKRRYGLGFFVRARLVGEIKRVPYELANGLLGLTPDPTITYPYEVDLKNMRLSNMAWVEYGANFGMMVKRDRDNLLSVGGNLKYLTGLSIAYANLLQLKGTATDLGLEVDKLKGKLRFSDFGWATGRGIGLDIGFTYKKMLEIVNKYYAHSTRSNCNFIDYKYKLGVSLRDVGAISFRKSTTKMDVDGAGSIRLTGRPDYQSEIQNNFKTTITNNPILASLPTALSVQFDWNFENYIYLNTTVIKNIVPNRLVGGQGSNLISICPRVEFKQIEVAMPLTFQKFIYPQLGFALRIRTFVLGFDNVFPLIIKKNTYGLNAYFNIGFSRFINRACNTGSSSVDDCSAKFKSGKKNKSRKSNNSRKSKRRG
jgi:hypothetical protein